MDKVDFLVVGAGIAGSSVAAELSRGHSVCLLEAEDQPGYHSTGRSAAVFSELYGAPIVRSLSRASKRQLFEPTAFAPGTFATQRGALFVATIERAEHLCGTNNAEIVRGTARKLETQAALALCPVLRPESVDVGLYEPGAADIDVHSLHQAYLKQLREHGGHLLTSRRVEAITRSAGIWEVNSGTETFAASVLINAAGAWAEQIALLASVTPLGLTPRRRTAVLIDAPEGHDIRNWPFVVDADETFYFKPDAGLLLLSPADEAPTEPCDAQADEWDVAMAVHRVTEATDLTVHRIRRRWAGLRTFAADRIPVVGFDPEVTDFFWLAGQGGFGVQTAPALSRVAAALACDQPIPPVIADFGVQTSALSPGRFKRVET
jgi:D-arginine dehydrogenase